MIYPAGGRLRFFTKQWKELKVSRWFQKGLSKGFKLPFTSRAQLRRQTRRIINVNLSKEDLKITKELVKDYQGKGITRPIRKEEVKHLSPVFPVPKTDKGYRLILNARRINTIFKKDTYRMETLRTILQQLKPGLWATKIDLKNAYVHIPIWRPHQGYLAFRIEQDHYCFQGLPFGLSFAPQLFTRVVDQMVVYLLRRGIVLYAYLDDLLLVHKDKDTLREQTKEALELLKRLGWSINEEKTIAEPQRELEHLGFSINFERLVLSIPKRKRLQVKKVTKELIRKAKMDSISCRDVARLTGMLQALTPGYQFAKAHMSALVECKREALAGSKDYSKPCHLTPEAKQELQFWSQHLPSLQGKPHALEPIYRWTTDASGYGLGATLGTFGNPYQKQFQEFLLKDHSHLSINFKELWAVYRSLEAFKESMRGHVVLHETDNTTVLSYLRRQRGGIPALDHLTRKIMAILEEFDITLIPTHLAGVLNVEADRLSRWKQKEDQRVNPITLAWIWHQERLLPSMDISASDLNKQCNRFLSYRISPGAVGNDFMRYDWALERQPYSNPPFTMIPKLIKRTFDLKQQLLLLIPKWPRRTWFHLLESHLQRQPVLIKPHKNLFLKGSDPNWEQPAPPWPVYFLSIREDANSKNRYSMHKPQVLDVSKWKVPNVQETNAEEILKQLALWDPHHQCTWESYLKLVISWITSHQRSDASRQ